MSLLNSSTRIAARRAALRPLFSIGESVVLRVDDEPRNQKIINKAVKVSDPPRPGAGPPYWMEVEDLDGERYFVRGSDCRHAQNRTAAEPLDPKMEAMLLKLRKGADSWLTFGLLKKVLDFLGGWKVEPIVGLVQMHYDHKDKPDLWGHIELSHDKAELDAKYKEIKSREVSTLPTKPTKNQIYTMKVEPVHQQENVWDKDKPYYLFRYLVWKGAEGIRFTAPNHRSFDLLPHRIDGDKRDFPPASKLRLYDLTPWLKSDTPFMEQILEKLGMEEHVPGTTRTRENTGSCSVCFRNIKLDPGQKIVLHGYERPGWGYVKGQCSGTDWPPLELSPKGSINYRETVLTPYKKQVEGTLEELKSGRLESIVVRRGRRNEPETLHRGTSGFDQAIKSAIHSHEGTLKQVVADIKMYTYFIDHWTLLPLPEKGKPAHRWKLPADFYRGSEI